MIRSVKVKPNSKNPRIEQAPDGALTVYLKSAPIEGRANEELIARLAEHYGLPKSRLRIKSGAGSRNKLIEIAPAS